MSDWSFFQWDHHEKVAKIKVVIIFLYHSDWLMSLKEDYMVHWKHNHSSFRFPLKKVSILFDFMGTCVTVLTNQGTQWSNKSIWNWFLDSLLAVTATAVSKHRYFMHKSRCMNKRLFFSHKHVASKGLVKKHKITIYSLCKTGEK